MSGDAWLDERNAESRGCRELQHRQPEAVFGKHDRQRHLRKVY